MGTIAIARVLPESMVLCKVRASAPEQARAALSHTLSTPVTVFTYSDELTGSGAFYKSCRGR